VYNVLDSEQVCPFGGLMRANMKYQTFDFIQVERFIVHLSASLIIFRVALKTGLVRVPALEKAPNHTTTYSASGAVCLPHVLYIRFLNAPENTMSPLYTHTALK
jgi:hypothetical protein